MTFDVIKNLKAHSDSVNAMCLTVDEDKLITVSSDKTIKLWNLKNYSELKTLYGHIDKIVSVTRSPISDLLVTSTINMFIK